MLALVLWASMAAVPGLVVEQPAAVEFESIHHQVRLLDAEFLALPKWMPLGYVLGTVGLELLGLGLIPLGLFFAIVSPWIGLTIGAFALALVSAILGFACLEAGEKVVQETRERRAEVIRLRAELLQRLSRPEAFLELPSMWQLAAF